MAQFKCEAYGDKFAYETGDEAFDKETGEQMSVTKKELVTAINGENLADKLFGRILVARKKAQAALYDKILGE